MALVSDPLPVREAGFDIKIDSRQTGTAEDRYFNGDFEMFWARGADASIWTAYRQLADVRERRQSQHRLLRQARSC
jgi:hypothetical protein